MMSNALQTRWPQSSATPVTTLLPFMTRRSMSTVWACPGFTPRVLRPGVPIKTDDQLDLQAFHRVRDRLMHRRMALINQVRGFLLERGITFAKGPANLHQMPPPLEDANQNLTPHMRSLLDHLWQEWKSLNSDIERASTRSPARMQLVSVCGKYRGVGPLVSTATVAARQWRGIPERPRVRRLARPDPAAIAMARGT
jgi:transposase